MNLLRGATNRIAAFYDAVTSNGRRKQRVVDNRSPDRILKKKQRDQLISNGRSLRRNFSEIAWLVRKHVVYVSTFSFQCNTGNPEFDRRIEELVEWWSRPQNCDAS